MIVLFLNLETIHRLALSNRSKCYDGLGDRILPNILKAIGFTTTP